jgi:hypothetical protein
MNKIYYVMIKGRTIESRDIKHLLARAVAEKRNRELSSDFSTSIHRSPTMKNLGNHYQNAR